MTDIKMPYMEGMELSNRIKDLYLGTKILLFTGFEEFEYAKEAVSESNLSGTVYNDKEGQALAMAKLSVALVSGRGMEDIEFENEKYVYMTYTKVTVDNIGEYLVRAEE